MVSHQQMRRRESQLPEASKSSPSHPIVESSKLIPLTSASNSFKRQRNRQLSLKLLIDTKGQRVLFAEADKKTVDFLFHILALPMATVIRLLSKQGMVGCLGNLYDSVQNLSDKYIQCTQNKEIILKPRIPFRYTVFSPLLTLPQDDKTSGGDDLEDDDEDYVVEEEEGDEEGDDDGYDDDGNGDDGDGHDVEEEEGDGDNNEEEVAGGFVEGVVTYMVMDDLVVKPILSTISSIVLLNKFNVKEVGSLQEKVVELGFDEALDLLRTSMSSNEVLTSVFLKKLKLT